MLALESGQYLRRTDVLCTVTCRSLGHAEQGYLEKYPCFRYYDKPMQQFRPFVRLILEMNIGSRIFRRFFVYQIIFFLICWDKELLNI